MTALQPLESQQGNSLTIEQFLQTDPRLSASDYDGTQFNTDELSPGGLDVKNAYAISIEETMGPDAARKFMQDGHDGRTVAEIAASVIPYADARLVEAIHDRVTVGEDISSVLGFARHEAAHLQHPKLQQLPLIDKATIEAVASVITEAKLELLMCELGKRLADGSFWPRPTAGFVEYSRAVDEAIASGRSITTALISAGHASFILKTYEMYEITAPDIILTDDVIQSVSPNLSVNRRSKPSPFPLALLKRIWLKENGVSTAVLQHPETKAAIDQRIIFIGDNLAKDGGLAERGHVAFEHLSNPFDPSAWQRLASSLGIEMEPVRG